VREPEEMVNVVAARGRCEGGGGGGGGTTGGGGAGAVAGCVPVGITCLHGSMRTMEDHVPAEGMWPVGVVKFLRESSRMWTGKSTPSDQT
jgi:hypothetical protein